MLPASPLAVQDTGAALRGMGYNEWSTCVGSGTFTTYRTRTLAATGGANDMDRRGRIRLSTMEIVLITTLIGSLVLGLLQARHEERRLRGEHDAGEHQ